MSKPTRWALVYAWFLLACATGGRSGGDDDAGDRSDAAVTRHDASTITPDAPKTQLDAGIVHDAFVPPDAPPGSIFCSSNSQCTTAGECCFTFGGSMGFCTPGTVVLGQCVPQ